MKPPTVDQLRSRIDSGLTGEKVAASDPAAAPLGTDAEAGGTPPTAEELALAYQSSPKLAHRPPPSGIGLYIMLAVGVSALLIALVVLTGGQS
jgi:hypothetical protein